MKSVLVLLGLTFASHTAVAKTVCVPNTTIVRGATKVTVFGAKLAVNSSASDGYRKIKFFEGVRSVDGSVAVDDLTLSQKIPAGKAGETPNDTVLTLVDLTNGVPNYMYFTSDSGLSYQLFCQKKCGLSDLKAMFKTVDLGCRSYEIIESGDASDVLPPGNGAT